MKEAQFGIKSLVFGSETVKRGLDVLTSINNTIDGLNNNTREPGINAITTTREPSLVGSNETVRKEVGQIYGRLMKELRLIQINCGDLNSMGKLEIESINSNVNFSELDIKWRRKYGENFIDIPNIEQNQRVYDLTADDIGTIILVEIKPKIETEDKLNITYGELGPICIDDSTRKSLLNSIRSGIVRFPVKLLGNEYDILFDPKKNNYLDSLNSMELIRDLLVITTEDVKVLRDGMSSSIGLNAEKRTEWSAKYFGGNIQVILDTNNHCEFTLISGNDLHKQSIRVKATSKNSRDILTLTIRCLNAKHLISVETILKCTLWSNILDSRFGTHKGAHNNINDNETNDYIKLDILSYTTKLEEDIVDLLYKEKKHIEDKNKIKNEKLILENELSETISAYQGIISQINIQDKKEEKCGDIQSNNDSVYESKKGENNVFNTNKSLLYGYNGGIYISNNDKETSSESNRNTCSNCSKSILSENIKLSTENANAKKIKDMESEILELKVKLDNSNQEKVELIDKVEKSKLEIENINSELELYKKYDLNNYKDEIQKISEYQGRILELESQNSEKQEVIKNIATEKSKLSKELSNLKFDFNRLKDQHNQLNKKYISLTMNNNGSFNESHLRDEITSLKQKVFDLENSNSELNATISNLKYRVRRLAMIKY
ncbi:hypothetical protein FG379_000907 [Cryptosporidium bovis]|uniref:uncharacterized protein n=1 Tax=Cryptosporidium bovis TaxID=310047 RepID=UPI00351A3E6E|nr:hypothetical protein FG379_000907 [Cryptosporidium bovis]